MAKSKSTPSQAVEMAPKADHLLPLHPAGVSPEAWAIAAAGGPELQKLLLCLHFVYGILLTGGAQEAERAALAARILINDDNIVITTTIKQKRSIQVGAFFTVKRGLGIGVKRLSKDTHKELVKITRRDLAKASLGKATVGASTPRKQHGLGGE